MKQQLRQELAGVFTFVAILWGVFILDWLLPGNWNDWGLVPRTLHGLIGIPLSTFLHANFSHLLSNSLPLVVLLVLMVGSRANTWITVAEIIVLGGCLLWVFGRSAIHIGASGLIYGLIAFLIVAGFREGRIVPLIISLIVGLLYGGTLLSGVLPTVGPDVSWDGHLFGAIAGGLIGYKFNASEPQFPTGTGVESTFTKIEEQ